MQAKVHWNPLLAPLSFFMLSPTLSRRTLLLAAAAFAASASLAPAADSPAALITAIYAAGKGDSGGQFVWLSAKSRPRWLSASLTRLWNETDAKVAPGD